MKETNKWNAAAYDEHARFVSDLGSPVLNLLAPKSGERILDVGCGDGELTLKIISAGADVVGIDASAEFVSAADSKGIDARQLQIEQMPFDQEFDAAFSNAVLHWVKSSQLAAERIFASLRPGGRFVAEFGGHGNIAAVRTALHASLSKRGCDPMEADPWYCPTADEYRRLLEQTGFEVQYAELIPRPTILPTDMRGWMNTFVFGWLNECRPLDAEEIIDEAAKCLEPILRDDAGVWTADYVRIRILAVRP